METYITELCQAKLSKLGDTVVCIFGLKEQLTEIHLFRTQKMSHLESAMMFDYTLIVQSFYEGVNIYSKVDEFTKNNNNKTYDLFDERKKRNSDKQ